MIGKRIGIYTLTKEDYVDGVKTREAMYAASIAADMTTRKFDKKRTDKEISIDGALYERAVWKYFGGILMPFRTVSDKDRGYDIVLDGTKIEICGIKSLKYDLLIIEPKWNRIRKECNVIYFTAFKSQGIRAWQKTYAMLGGITVEDFDKKKTHQGPDNRAYLSLNNWAIEVSDLTWKQGEKNESSKS